MLDFQIYFWKDLDERVVVLVVFAVLGYGGRRIFETKFAETKFAFFLFLDVLVFVFDPIEITIGNC